MTADERLDEWGRWSRSGDPDRSGHVDICPVFSQYIPDGDDEGIGGIHGEANAPEAVEAEVVDWRADETDKLIMRLAIVHLLTVKRHYYNGWPIGQGRQRIYIMDLYAAWRALDDLLDRDQRRAA